MITKRASRPTPERTGSGYLVNPLGHDSRALFNTIHRQTTGELLHLLDGFYSNIEDGLFELAYRATEDSQRRRCFDLMRELRFRRAALVKNFARAMDRNRELWHEFDTLDSDTVLGHDLESLVVRMAEKTHAHFSGLLGAIAERAEAAGSRSFGSATELPISPHRVAQAFVHSCRSLRFDQDSIEIVQELFRRFVLDGLGTVYGACNLFLLDEGFLTSSEIEFCSTAS